jgi:probable phosphoglycerate mutase
MGNLILVRHATTTSSAAGRNLGQRSDLALASEGVQLADRLAGTLEAEMAELPHTEVRAVTSPALRCRQTLAPIVRRIGLPDDAVEVETGLLEIDYGDWDGLTADECRARDPQLRKAWEADPYRTRCPSGESGADVAARAFAVFDAVDAWLAVERSRVAIVVSHNHVNRIRLCAVFGWPMREYRERLSQDPGAYSIIGIGAGQPVVRRVNAAPTWEAPGRSEVASL